MEYLDAKVAAEKKIKIQGMRDHRVDGSAWRNVPKLAYAVTLVGGHEARMMPLLDHDESQSWLVRLVRRQLSARQPDGAHLGRVESGNEVGQN